jgi:hypothetical protein
MLLLLLLRVPLLLLLLLSLLLLCSAHPWHQALQAGRYPAAPLRPHPAQQQPLCQLATNAGV